MEKNTTVPIKWFIAVHSTPECQLITTFSKLEADRHLSHMRMSQEKAVAAGTAHAKMSLVEDDSEDEEYERRKNEVLESSRESSLKLEEAEAEEEAAGESNKRQRVEQTPEPAESSTSSSSSSSSSSWSAVPVSRKIEELKGLRIDEFVKDEEFIYFCHPGYDKDTLAKKTRMIGFDMDGCLIDTKSGCKFPTDYVTDWKPWRAEVATKLRELHESGAYLCIISNQGGIEKGRVRWTEVELKIREVVKAMGVPMDFICCHRAHSVFRKPSVGAWQLMQKHRCPNAIQSDSHYVGDAAGRPAGGGRKKDFADSDYKLALNLGVSFFTPEHFFLGNLSPHHCDLPTPKPFAKLSTCGTQLSPEAVERIMRPEEVVGPESAKEIVLIVAPAGAGKSTLARMIQERSRPQDEYVIVNQDTLQTRPRCLAAARSAMSVKRANIIVDNTNLSQEIRAEWVKLANQHGYQTRCIYLKTSKEVAKTQVVYRMLCPHTPSEDRRAISDVVLNTHFKNLMVPSAFFEGFYRLDEMPWHPLPPTSATAKQLFDSYLR